MTLKQTRNKEKGNNREGRFEWYNYNVYICKLYTDLELRSLIE